MRIDRNAAPTRLTASDRIRLSNAATIADRPRTRWTVPFMVRVVVIAIIATPVVDAVARFLGVIT